MAKVPHEARGVPVWLLAVSMVLTAVSPLWVEHHHDETSAKVAEAQRDGVIRAAEINREAAIRVAEINASAIIRTAEASREKGSQVVPEKHPHHGRSRVRHWAASPNAP